MAHTERLRQKWVAFSGFRFIWKDRDFTRSSIWKGREICHLGLWKRPKDLTNEFYGFIKSGKRSIFVIDSYLNDNAFTEQLKGMHSPKQSIWKGYHLSIERRMYPFREKWYIKCKGVGPRGGASPYKNTYISSFAGQTRGGFVCNIGV